MKESNVFTNITLVNEEILIDNAYYSSVINKTWIKYTNNDGTWTIKTKCNNKLITIAEFIYLITLSTVLNTDKLFYINGNSKDNRLTNIGKHKSIDSIGTYMKKNKFYARILIENKRYLIGSFATKLEAEIGYDTVCRHYFPNKPLNHSNIDTGNLTIDDAIKTYKTNRKKSNI